MEKLTGGLKEGKKNRVFGKQDEDFVLERTNAPLLDPVTIKGDKKMETIRDDEAGFEVGVHAEKTQCRFRKQINQEAFEKFKLNSFKSSQKTQRQAGLRLAAHEEEEDDVAHVHGKKALVEENCPVLMPPSSDKRYRDMVVDLTEEESSFCSKTSEYSCYGNLAKKKDSDMGKWQKAATGDF